MSKYLASGKTMMSFQRALVTGASSGIGRALSVLLAKKQIPLLITSRNRKSLEELKASLEPLVDVQIIEADLSSPVDREKLLSAAKEYEVDLVINNAGFGLYGPAISHETKELLKMVEVNVQAVVEISVAFAKSFSLQKKKGVIVNISSVASFFSFPNFSVYAATKSFVTQFSQALDYELTPFGIRVLTSCPGMVATDFQKKASSGIFAKKPSLSITAEKAAKKIYLQICKGKSLEVFPWKYKLMIFFSKFCSHRKLQSILAKSLQGRFLE